MKEKTLERKIKKSTLNKDYESSKFILLNCYIKQFKKMIKYKGGKINKKWFLGVVWKNCVIKSTFTLKKVWSNL